jgi:hypothetical protein
VSGEPRDALKDGFTNSSADLPNHLKHACARLGFRQYQDVRRRTTAFVPPRWPNGHKAKAVGESPNLGSERSEILKRHFINHDNREKILVPCQMPEQRIREISVPGNV